MNDVVAYRIDVLKNGIYNREVKWAADSSPQIDFNADSVIKSSFKCELYEEIDLNTEELNPCMYRNGTWKSLGVFRPTTMTVSGTEYGKVYSYEAYDRAWVLKMRKIETILHLSQGTAYLTAIQNLLADAGISLVVKDSNNSLLPADREDWSIGTDYLTIINALLSEIGFNELWFDDIGAAHLQEYKPITAEEIKHQYSTRDFSQAPIGDDYESEEDIYDSPNVFIAICQNADRTATLTATAVNNSAVSRKSVLNRNLRIPQVVKVNQISDQEALQTYANKLRDDSMYGTKTVTYYTYNEAGHGLRDIVALDHPQLFGLYEEVSWSLTMGIGELMTHKARKAVL